MKNKAVSTAAVAIFLIVLIIFVGIFALYTPSGPSNVVTSSTTTSSTKNTSPTSSTSTTTHSITTTTTTSVAMIGGGGGGGGEGGGGGGGSSSGGGSGGGTTSQTTTVTTTSTTTTTVIARSSGPVPNKMVYGYFIDRKGQWNNPEPPAVATSAVLNSSAVFMKTTNAAIAGDGHVDSSLQSYIQQLLNASMHLEVRVDALDSGGNPRNVSDIQAQASAIKAIGYYDTVFVDHALENPNLQAIVDMLKSMGFRVIINSSAFGTNRQVVDEPTGVWIHAKAFGVMQKNSPYLAQVEADNLTNIPLITPNDTSWIAYINQRDPGSYPVLKLEDAAETAPFSNLPLAEQQQLLTFWAQNQQAYGYIMIYPLFTGNGCTPDPGTTGCVIDSVAQGTYNLQVQLMNQYN